MAKRTFVFGGAFDPPTRAHVAIAKMIRESFVTPEDRFVIFVSNTDEKKYTIDAETRLRMAMTAFASNKYPTEVHIQNQRTFWALKELGLDILGDDKVVLCMGEDQAISLANGNWEWANTLRDKCDFVVIDRSTTSCAYRFLPKEKILGVGTAPDCEGVSSSLCRETMERDPMAVAENKVPVTEEVAEFILGNKLYKQNGRDYDKEMEEFIQNYKAQKALHGWGEPSVTADIVAFNSDEEVLLVRRKGFPYKNFWALPGGFFDLSDDDICNTAQRELEEETNLDLDVKKFEQIKAYGHIFDPRLRIIDVAFSVAIPEAMEGNVKAKDDAAEVKWWPMYNLPRMAFHHAQIIEDFIKSNNNHFK